MDFKKIIKKFLQGNKEQRNKNLLVVFLVGIVFLIAGSFFKSSNSSIGYSSNEKKSEKVEETIKIEEEYENVVKKDLIDILSKLEGVGKVEVMLTLESGEENVLATNSSDSNSSVINSLEQDKSTNTQGNSSSTVVITNSEDGSTKPLIVKTYKPKVCGVVVVAEGAADSITKLRITKSVMDLFNVSMAKVNVYPMKK